MVEFDWGYAQRLAYTHRVQRVRKSHQSSLLVGLETGMTVLLSDNEQRVFDLHSEESHIVEPSMSQLSQQ